jgi:hypothetical protein
MKRMATLAIAAAWWLPPIAPAAHAGDMKPDAITPDGGRYFGPMADGKRQGRGRVEWDNGARYEGEFVDGLFSGEGKYDSGSGYTYEGHYDKGIMAGHGRYVMAGGSVYVGEFVNNQFNGEGRLTGPGGYSYEGHFTNGLFDGAGKFSSAEEEYRGNFVNGRYSGKGELRYKDGRNYRGEFSEGVFHGKGRFETPDGQIYEGDFVKGQFTGSGTYLGARGARHVGQFRNWRPHGAGTFTDNKGNAYEGNFEDGALNGKGKLTGKDGRSYEGEFRRWKFHGKGTLHFANGDEYRGDFADGLFEGQGVMTYARPRPDGRTKDAGTWRYGTLEDKEAERRTRERVETALYRQRAMLDAAIGTLQPRDSSRINMYFLAVAGDGSEEVFRREAEFVRRQFDADFQTQGRSLLLANSHEKSDAYPMATLTSVRESLDAMARRMDRDNDILFVYLTSHGSKTHELILNEDGLSLENLQAAALGRMLASTGIRWKVVVVSACYAGGFIDPVKDEHTLVITAARRDRTSFGCADENDFTYFGRAFFEQALPKSASFEDAFAMAQTLVDKWETEDIARQAREAAQGERDDGEDGEAEPIQHSEPQIHRPAAVLEQLKKWRAQLPARTSGAAVQDGAVTAR